MGTGQGRRQRLACGPCCLLLPHLQADWVREPAPPRMRAGRLWSLLFNACWLEGEQSLTLPGSQSPALGD